MTPGLIIDLVGEAAALCSIASFAPQIVKIWRERDASSVSFKTYSLTVTGFVLWTTYGLLPKPGLWPWPTRALSSSPAPFSL